MTNMTCPSCRSELPDDFLDNAVSAGEGDFLIADSRARATYPCPECGRQLTQDDKGNLIAV
jgi:DNA-directed RNA polymerase subunit RPC12/RpoP